MVYGPLPPTGFCFQALVPKLARFDNLLNVLIETLQDLGADLPAGACIERGDGLAVRIPPAAHIDERAVM